MTDNQLYTNFGVADPTISLRVCDGLPIPKMLDQVRHDGKTVRYDGKTVRQDDITISRYSFPLLRILQIDIPDSLYVIPGLTRNPRT